MSSFVQATVGGLSILGQNLTGFHLVQAQGAAEVGVLSTRALITDGKAYLNGTPVSVFWGSVNAEKFAGAFYGYIDHIQPHHDNDNSTTGRADMDLVLVGATMVMQSGGQRSWNGRRMDSIASDVIGGHRLTAVVDTSPYVWSNIVQSGESDWQFLVAQAKKVGFSLVPTGTVVRFIDPTRTLAVSTPSAYYSMSSAGVAGSIDLFTPVLGNPIDSDYADRQAVGVNDQGNVVKYSSTFAPNTKPAAGLDRLSKPRSLVVNTPLSRSYGESQALLDGMNKASWAVTATMSARGLGIMRPGLVIDVQGVGAEYTGSWYVLSCTHTVPLNGFYMVHMNLARDAVRQQQTAQRLFSLPSVVDTGTSQRVPQTIQLPNGQWAAAWGQ